VVPHLSGRLLRRGNQNHRRHGLGNVSITSINQFPSQSQLDHIQQDLLTFQEEDEEIFEGVDLSDFMSESDEEERNRRKDDPDEYGRLETRRIRHEDELNNPKYNGDLNIRRNKKRLPNVNNLMHGTKIRNFKAPTAIGTKFDSNGTPKYPIIYEVRKCCSFTPHRQMSSQIN